MFDRRFRLAATFVVVLAGISTRSQRALALSDRRARP